jgi:hypothetical protein
VEEGADIQATMTVDGVETPIEAGTYEGVIVLTPVETSPIVEVDGEQFVLLDSLLDFLGL